MLFLFEWLALAAGIACVWLLMRQNIWTFPIGMVFSALTVVVLVYQNLYANVLEMAYYLFMNGYGWYVWQRGERAGAQRIGELPVTDTPTAVYLPLLVVFVVVSLGLGYGFARWTDADLAYWDSASTTGAFVAMWMSARKYLQSWVLWFVVDVVYVGLYFYKGLFGYSLLYLVYLAMAIAGWRAWRTQMQPSSA